MKNFLLDSGSKCAAIKNIEIDISTVDFTVLDEYNPQTVEGGYTRMNVGSKKRDDWEKDKYRLALLSVWKSTGMTNADIAKQMGITYKTLKLWLKESEPISEALNTGKNELVNKLAGAMVQRALGIEYEEVKTTVLGDVRKGSKVVENQQTVKVEKVTKQHAPDVGALCFMLTNLDPDNWKNRRNNDTNLTGAVPVVISGGEDLEE